MYQCYAVMQGIDVFDSVDVIIILLYVLQVFI